ncbi:DivIVA domain-containing protein [Corynebacterium guangdongense]|uniref:DivIVA domain-containing protein n=1 Tax=Corynebacterium guangdongense TaxID=1783348 RepID=A0ABU1ZVR9_9CORY|nr:DivIVA domain-containing protein [Corynebacterium guangdongense]MDR7329032.1 DivIVA domain-containing protein [Corynebacterium guangdongense]WJZ17602.1 hypothetical protein CGUA_05085 [Corynebacterium guangdongense]
MLTWLLLILVLIALTILGTWFWGRIFGRGEVLPPMDEPASVIRDNRELIRGGDVAGVRFEMVTRGYRPDQVDDAIATLQAELAQARSELTQPRPDHHA